MRFSAVRQNYYGLAQEYEMRWARFLNISRCWVLDHFPDLAEGADIIDLGCGTGAFLEQIYQRNSSYNLTGIDGSSAMLAIARGRDIKAQWKEEDLNRPVSDDRKYDLALSLNIIHHLDDPQSHIVRLKNLIRPDGTIFLCDFAIDSLLLHGAHFYWHCFDRSYHKAFSSAALERMIRQSGFAIEKKAVLKPDRFWLIQIYALRI